MSLAASDALLIRSSNDAVRNKLRPSTSEVWGRPATSVVESEGKAAEGVALPALDADPGVAAGLRLLLWSKSPPVDPWAGV